jgi:hypothetical protein
MTARQHRPWLPHHHPLPSSRCSWARAAARCLAMGDAVILYCRWLLFLREPQSNLAAIAIMYSQNDSVTRGQGCLSARAT